MVEQEQEKMSLPGDLDKDWYSNCYEFLMGSDPTNRNDPDPRPRAMPWIPLLLND
jgi:hypothetical protein